MMPIRQPTTTRILILPALRKKSIMLPDSGFKSRRLD
jgi:hypothetical protein